MADKATFIPGPLLDFIDELFMRSNWMDMLEDSEKFCLHWEIDIKSLIADPNKGQSGYMRAYRLLVLERQRYKDGGFHFTRLPRCTFHSNSKEPHAIVFPYSGLNPYPNDTDQEILSHTP